MGDLISSKRFWAAVATLIGIIVNAIFPTVPQDQVVNIVLVVATWIVGETFRPVTSPESRQ